MIIPYALATRLNVFQEGESASLQASPCFFFFAPPSRTKSAVRSPASHQISQLRQPNGQTEDSRRLRDSFLMMTTHAPAGLLTDSVTHRRSAIRKTLPIELHNPLLAHQPLHTRMLYSSPFSLDEYPGHPYRPVPILS
jgi:hypothetical protein